MKKKKVYFLSFFVPVFLFILFLLIFDIFPFSNTSIRMVDSLSQYPAYFELLKNFKIFGFNLGMGMNYYPILTSYLLSPLNVLYFLFDKFHFEYFYFITLILKIGLIGLNTNIFLNYKKKINMDSIIFSTIFALGSYTCLNFVNIQFLDTLYMLPLVLIGLDKLIFDNKRLMYYITLSLTIIFNYYLGFMVCVFLVIYFTFVLINNECKNKKRIISDFFITSFLCGMTASIVILPTYAVLALGRINQNAIPSIFKINRNLFPFFYNMTTGNQVVANLDIDGIPTFITLFSLVYVIFIFFNKNYSKKYKISVLCLFIIYFLSVSTQFLYFFWHLFQHPNCFMGRFTFVFNFLFIYLSYESFINRDSINISVLKRMIIWIILTILFGFGLFYKLRYYEPEARTIVYLILNVILVLIYLLLYDKKYLKYLIFFEIFMCFTSFYTFLISSKGNYNYKEESAEIRKFETKLNNIEDKDFYRVNTTQKKSGFLFNYGTSLDYNSIMIYSSFYNQNLYNFFDIFFENMKEHLILYRRDSIIDSILSNKYYYDYYDMHKNPYTIESIGYMVYDIKDEYNEKIDILNDISNTEIQEFVIDGKVTLDNAILDDNNNYIVEDKDKETNILIEYNIDDDYIVSTFIDSQDNIEIKNDYYEYVNFIDIYLNDELVDNLLEVKSGDKIKVNISLTYDELNYFSKDKIKLGVIKKDEYINAINILKQNKIYDYEYNKYGFTGKIKVNKEKNILLLTIPYSKDYEIYLNGEKINYYKAMNGLMALDLDEGEYEIDFRYTKKYQNISIILSLFGILSFIVYNIFMRSIGDKNEKLRPSNK